MQLFNNLNQDKTRKNVKHLLEGYRELQLLEKQHAVMSLTSQVYDGMSHSAQNRNGMEEHTIDKISKIQEQVQQAKEKISLIVNTVKALREIDEVHDKYAEILELRYLKHFSVNKCCMQMAEKYDCFTFPVSTYYDYLNDALLDFAWVYPDNSILCFKAS